MEPAKLNWLHILFFTFAAILPTLMANLSSWDQVWYERSIEAQKEAVKSYEVHPEKIIKNFNTRVYKALKKGKHHAVKGKAFTHPHHLNLARKQLLEAQLPQQPPLPVPVVPPQPMPLQQPPLSVDFKIPSAVPGPAPETPAGPAGECTAVNPIDKCWRCNPKWADNRKKLADCVIGFGHNARGGADGPIYTVTDPSDDDVREPKNGTLRHAVIQKGPLWIIFDKDMTIKLSQELIMQSHKTIDGRGFNITIAGGAGLVMHFVKNIIVSNIAIHNTISTPGGIIRDSVDHIGHRDEADGDAISVFGCSTIWIDHVTMSHGVDGLVDVIHGSTAVTISNCHFSDHNKVMLLGASDLSTKDMIMQVTVAFNVFAEGCTQRMPRVRFGFAHVVNNDYIRWNKYAIGGSSHPTILSQGNRFTAGAVKAVTKRQGPLSEWKNWVWISDGDLLLEGAEFVTSGDPAAAQTFTNGELIKADPATFVGELTKFAGQLNCKVGQPC